MGRLSTIDDREVFANVGAQLGANGTFRVQDLVAGTGVSVGSLYHRYGGRDGLLASAWLDALRTFQDAFLGALQGGDLRAGEQAALATPRFCRAEHGRALVLHLGRRAEFLSPATPPDLMREIDAINQSGQQALAHFARSTDLPRQTVHMSLVALPLGAVRFYLPGKVPASVDEHVRKAYWGVVG